jgi:fluoride ion exporter CrcB/FEX
MHGILVYSHYYAKDTPGPHQQATNVACVATFAIVGTALRSLCGEFAVFNGWTPSPPSITHGNTTGIQHPPPSHTDPVFFRDLLANCLGTLLMGIAVGVSPYALPRFPNVYVGFTTGLCGCLTTCSGWNASAAAILATGAVHRAALCLIIGLASAGASLRLGLLIGSRLVRSHLHERAVAAAATETAHGVRWTPDTQCAGLAGRGASAAHCAACPTAPLLVASIREVASAPRGEPMASPHSAHAGASVECSVGNVVQPPPWPGRGISAVEVPIEEIDGPEEAAAQGAVGLLEVSSAPLKRVGTQLDPAQSAPHAPCGSESRPRRSPLP